MAVITLFEHQSCRYADLGWETDHPALAQLEQLNDAAGTEFVSVGRRHLRATQHVGVMRVGDVTIQILPKIDYDPAGDADAGLESRPYASAVASATRNLLHLLSYACDLELHQQEIAPLLARRSDWFELLTRLFAAELHRQLLAGVPRAYVQLEETIPLIRGRWQLARQLTRRPHVRHLFDVSHDEFSPDTVLNRVFAYVAGRLLFRTADAQNRRLLRDVDAWLSEVPTLAEISPAELALVRFDRLNERFRPAFNLARLFVENSTFQLSAGSHETFAFVFDMNRLFEEFVGRFIVRHRRRILPADWERAEVRLQSRGRPVYLAERLPGYAATFRLVPDVLIAHRAAGTLLVLDTKYKQLDMEARRLGIAEADMYQMVAYALRLGCRRVLLVYPEWPVAARVPIEFVVRDAGIRIVVATINLRQPLDRPDGLIGELQALFNLAASPLAQEVV